jgi:asparagine N-glycosylation enzyme membrane subunit Stt3
MKQKLASILLRRWVIIALILIIVFGAYVRLVDYRWPYLRNIDSYNFARDIEDIISNHGALPARNELAQAPFGVDRVISQDFYVYFAAYVYMFYHAATGTEMFQFLLLFPALLGALLAVPMYFLVKTLYDKKAAVMAAAFIVFDTAIMARTLAGDPDSDGIVLIMPLIVLALYFMTYKISSAGFTKKTIIMSLLTGLSLAAWYYTWSGYWFVVWIITSFLLAKIVIRFFGTKKIMYSIRSFKTQIFSYAIIIAILLLLTVPVFGASPIVSTVTGPFSFQEIKSEAKTFPNVYVSVAELQAPGDAKEIINRIGMPFFFLVFSLIYLLYSFAKKRQHADIIILLLIWFVGPFIATLAAIRFTILFSAPIAIGTGILFSKILRLTSGEDKSMDD